MLLANLRLSLVMQLDQEVDAGLYPKVSRAAGLLHERVLLLVEGFSIEDQTESDFLGTTLTVNNSIGGGTLE